MPQYVMSRRSFLAAAGLSAATLACGINTIVTTGTPFPTIPAASPFRSGPYATTKLILGEDVTTVLPQPLDRHQFPGIPSTVHAAVYFPYFAGTDHRVPTTDPFSGTAGHIPPGPFPLLLYAHAFRDAGLGSPTDTPSYTRDFTSVEIMMRQVAGYGCVTVVPDLSWLPVAANQQGNWDLRATVLVAYYQFVISTLNFVFFENQVDTSRVILVGHSRGGGGATHAGRQLRAMNNPPHTIAYGLIAPEGDSQSRAFGGDSQSDIGNLLVLGGTLDIDQGADPGSAYMAGGTPKTLVTIPGANHFGYTDICPPDNGCDTVKLFDENGTISRVAQQMTAASYLAALVRYYARGDASALPYLYGSRIVEGLSLLGVTGIQVQQQGLQAPTPTPQHQAHP